MTAINPSVPRRVEPFRMRRPHLQWQMHTRARRSERGLHFSSVFFVKLDAEAFRTPARKARFSPRLWRASERSVLQYVSAEATRFVIPDGGQPKRRPNPRSAGVVPAKQ